MEDPLKCQISPPRYISSKLKNQNQSTVKTKKSKPNLDIFN